MSLIRCPFLPEEIGEKEIAYKDKMRPGYMIYRSDLEELEKLNGEPFRTPAIQPEAIANTRFRSKVSGALGSYLINNKGFFTTPDSHYANSLGIEDEDGLGMPTRVGDALLLEKHLVSALHRARHLLSMLDAKFARSEHDIEFRDQPAPGLISRDFLSRNFEKHKNKPAP